MHPKDHAAIVTGGGSGLGAATAKRLAAEGAKVTVIDINAEGAEAVAKEIGGLAITADVSDAASLEAAVAKARDAHGAARIAVACAGIVRGERIIGKEGASGLDIFQKVINVNLVGAYNLMRLTAADMSNMDALEDGERGLIVMTSSVAAYEGQIGQAAYAASKGGIASLVLPAARDLSSRGIRVTAIAPGLFGTPMMFGLPEAVQESLAQSTPFPKRLGTGEEFADLVMAFANNVMLNGEVIRIDGALRLAPR